MRGRTTKYDITVFLFSTDHIIGQRSAAGLERVSLADNPFAFVIALEEQDVFADARCHHPGSRFVVSGLDVVSDHEPVDNRSVVFVNVELPCRRRPT
jgi:hypothetical protein